MYSFCLCVCMCIFFSNKFIVSFQFCVFQFFFNCFSLLFVIIDDYYRFLLFSFFTFSLRFSGLAVHVKTFRLSLILIVFFLKLKWLSFFSFLVFYCFLMLSVLVVFDDYFRLCCFHILCVQFFILDVYVLTALFSCINNHIDCCFLRHWWHCLYFLRAIFWFGYVHLLLILTKSFLLMYFIAFLSCLC